MAFGGFSATRPTFRIVVHGNDAEEIFARFIEDNEDPPDIAGPDWGSPDGPAGGGYLNGTLRAVNEALRAIERTINSVPQSMKAAEQQAAAPVIAKLLAIKAAIEAGQPVTALILEAIGAALTLEAMSMAVSVIMGALVVALIAIGVAQIALRAILIGKNCGWEAAKRVARLAELARQGSTNPNDYIPHFEYLKDCQGNGGGNFTAAQLQAAAVEEVGNTESITSDWVSYEGATEEGGNPCGTCGHDPCICP